MMRVEAKIVKTRKDHKCLKCEAVIPKGSRVWTMPNANYYVGKTYTDYWCNDCYPPDVRPSGESAK